MSCIERANQQCIRPLHFNVFHIVYWPPVNRFTLHAFIGYIVAQIATNCTMPFSHFSCVCMFCFVLFHFRNFPLGFGFFLLFFHSKKNRSEHLQFAHRSVLCFISFVKCHYCCTIVARDFLLFLPPSCFCTLNIFCFCLATNAVDLFRFRFMHKH